MSMTPTLEMRKSASNEVTVTRSFAAPVSLVWRAFTEPELIKRWLTGPPGHSMSVCEVDLRAGGNWRYVWLIPVEEMEAYGQFLEVLPQQKIVHTETFAMWPDNSSQVTTLFEPQADGSTLVTMVMAYDSEATRDMVLKTGMTDGMEMSYQRLESILPEYSA